MLLLPVLVSLSTAQAATCDAQLAKVGSLSPEAAAGAFGDLVACDRKVAEANFNRYLERATDTDALVDLVMKAVDSDVWNPAWASLGKISNYEARDEVARRIGEGCGEHPKVVTFFQGAYAGLRNVDFAQWDDGIAACGDAKLGEWVAGRVADPPAKSFDEKYSTLVSIYVKQNRGEALPSLTAAAIKASENGGPFDDLLQHMSAAVQPELGQQLSADDQKKLADAMVAVAQKVSVDRARAVASELANAGAESAAASLLPKLYPDRVQAGGGFLYAVGAMESCAAEKTAVFHYTTATEPGKRWAILADLEPVMRAVKAKVKDCTVESPWPVMHSPEPIKSAGEADAWAAGIVKEWEGKGFEVKTQKEKGVALP